MDVNDAEIRPIVFRARTILMRFITIQFSVCCLSIIAYSFDVLSCVDQSLSVSFSEHHQSTPER